MIDERKLFWEQQVSQRLEQAVRAEIRRIHQEALEEGLGVFVSVQLAPQCGFTEMESMEVRDNKFLRRCGISGGLKNEAATHA